MKVFRNLDSIQIKRPVATIGIFDGVHLAHQAIIEKLKLKAFELNGESTLVTLWPHPRIVLQKDADSLRMLTTMDEKIERLKETGIDNLVIIPFDKNFAATGFDTFIRETMVGKINIAHLVVGFNHQFGKNREGNFEKLSHMADELGFGLAQQDPVLIEADKVSSSAIRRLLEAGNVERANQFLGYSYCITGHVVQGNQKGREIGFPTANIVPNESIKMVPRNGVYAIRTRYKDNWYTGMMNIGIRPTLPGENSEIVIEAHLFHFDGNLYGQEVEVEFLGRIREEQKFASFEELRKQIQSDQEAVKKMLKEA